MFDDIVINLLKESVVTLSKDDLDSTVFTSKMGGVPVLHDAIKIQILKDIDEIRKTAPVVNFYLIGSILTKNYDRNSDLDITVQIDEQFVDNISAISILHVLKELNGKLATGSSHPINYYITTQELDTDKTEAVYDIVNEKWLKTPKSYDPDVEKWNVKFQDTLKSIDISTGKLRRDLIDIEEMKNLDNKKLKTLKNSIKIKLDQIESLLKDLIGSYKNIKMEREMAFDKFMTPQEIQLYGSRNKLPENVLYKLLEKYYYIKFIKKIEEILSDKDGLELSDISKVKKVMGNLWKDL